MIPQLDAVALVPDAARADDAGVVVRVGPLAHHVDLHGLVGRVRRRGAALPGIAAPIATTATAATAKLYRLSARFIVTSLPPSPCTTSNGAVPTIAGDGAERVRTSRTSDQPQAPHCTRPGTPSGLVRLHGRRSTSRFSRDPSPLSSLHGAQLNSSPSISPAKSSSKRAVPQGGPPDAAERRLPLAPAVPASPSTAWAIRARSARSTQPRSDARRSCGRCAVGRRTCRPRRELRRLGDDCPARPRRPSPARESSNASTAARSRRAEPPFAEIAVERLRGEGPDRRGRRRARRGRPDGDGRRRDDRAPARPPSARPHAHRRHDNLAVIEELLPEPGVELVLPGGVVRRNYRSLVGVLAEDSLRQLASDIAFLGYERRRRDCGSGTRRWSRCRSSGDDRRPGEVVLLADAAKFSMTGVVRVCGADDSTRRHRRDDPGRAATDARRGRHRGDIA